MAAISHISSIDNLLSPQDQKQIDPVARAYANADLLLVTNLLESGMKPSDVNPSAFRSLLFVSEMLTHAQQRNTSAHLRKETFHEILNRAYHEVTQFTYDTLGQSSVKARIKG